MSKHNTPADYPKFNEYGHMLPDEKPKKSRKGWIIALLSIAIVIIIAALAGPGDDTDTAPADTTTQDEADHNALLEMGDKSGHTLRFEAETSDGSTGNITYIGQGTNITQNQDQPMPWSVDMPPVDNTYDVIGANVSVQQNGSGSVSCKVIWDGEIVSENSSTGEYAMVTCSLPGDVL